MSGLGNLLLPDWVQKRREKEQLEQFLDQAALHEKELREFQEKQAKGIRDGGKQAHRMKMISKNRTANKNARRARRRNRVG